MKINKKVLIPIFASAMGLSVIGGVSGAVAWYQYNTKVTASWVGATMADGGVLQISTDNGVTWKRDADFGGSSTKLHPITFGGMGASDALPTAAKKHPHAGVTDPTQWDDAVAADYFQCTFNLKAEKIDKDTNTVIGVDAPVSIKEFVLQSATTGKTEVVDAIRIHITDGTNHKLLSKQGGSINTYGALDLDGDGSADVKGGYQWEENREQELVYGVANSTQSSTALAADLPLFTVPAGGATYTMTIWLEGWQQLRSSAIWDVTKDGGANIQFGFKLETPKTTFIAE